MNFDFSSLEPKIQSILLAPDTDLKTITAKRVRKQLSVVEPALTPEFLREHKDEVDHVISSVFEMVNSQETAEAASQVSSDAEPPTQTDDDNEEAQSSHYDEQPISLPRKRPAKTKKPGLDSDAVLARKLSEEINGRARPSRNGSKARGSSTGTPRKAARVRKSAATVDSDDDSSGEGKGSRPRTRKPAGRGGGGGFAKKEYFLSPSLAVVVGEPRMARPQVVKKLWEYIKGNTLQNPNNKREILCDENFKAVFNTERIDMFKMNKVLGQYLHDEPYE